MRDHFKRIFSLSLKMRIRVEMSRWLARTSALRAAFEVMVLRRNICGPVIAVSLLNHIGDLVLTEPIPRLVRSMFPGAVVVWITRSAYRNIVAQNPEVDAVVCVECIYAWDFLSRIPGVFDRVIDLHPNFRQCPRCSFTLQKIYGNPRVTVENYWESRTLLGAFCAAGGLPEIDVAPRAHIPNSARTEADTLELPREFIVVHCHSNEAAKDWTEAKWMKLIKIILSRLQIPVIAIGAERAFTEELFSGTKEFRDLSGRVSLLGSAEIIRRSRLFVGIDSGPAHFANAVGTPGVVLLGQYRHFSRVQPYTGRYASGRSAIIVRNAGPVSEIEVSTVFNAVESQLSGSVAIPSES